jgi:hypothetical protein
MSQFKLESNLRKSLEYFFDLCDKMEKRAIDICTEIRKKYERRTGKKGNFDDIK